MLYIYHTYARYLAVRYVIFLLLRKCVHGLGIFRLGLVGLTADHDASRGSSSGLPGGPCASSVIILPLDPHLVDASVNFENLSYL